jgi:putative oxygen-independent coproporphyrinogen III oxidase
MSGFGIYVHWPYCAAKCPYCDFNSHVRDAFSETRWGDAILRELDFTAGLQSERPSVASVFFGGGTPSLMSGRAVARVLDGIAKLWPTAADVEITLEANPNSVEQERFRDYRAAGVNRVSIGVQSLDGAALKALGRLHGVEEARNAIQLAQRIFPRSSFDLIYARPHQTPEAWTGELKDALAFGTEHLSLYQLTIEPGTAYATLARQGKLIVPDEDAAAALYDVTETLCAASGLGSYEVSNYARPDAESRHNLVYWRYGDYAGIGPGAHGRLTLDGKRMATEAERLPEKWLAAIEQRGSSIALSDISTEAAREHLLMGLRLAEGIDLEAYRARWNVSPSSSRIADLSADGLIAVDGTHLRTTARGRLVLNAVIAQLADSLNEVALRVP